MDDDKMSYRAKLEAERDELREKVRSLESDLAEQRSDAAMMAEVRDNLQAQLEDMSRARKRLEAENAALRRDEWRNRAVAAEKELADNDWPSELAHERRANAKMLEQIDEWRSRAVALTKELEATRQGNRELLAERDQLRAQVTQLGELGQQLRESCSRANVRAQEAERRWLDADDESEGEEDEGDESGDDEVPLADVTGAYSSALVAMLAELTSSGVEVVLRRDGAGPAQGLDGEEADQ